MNDNIVQIANVHLAIFLAIMLLAIGCSCFLLRRYGKQPFAYVPVFTVYALVVLSWARCLGVDGFHILTLAAWGIFCGGPVMLIIGAVFAKGNKLIAMFALFVLLAITDIAVALDAFVIEPHSLETRYVHLTSSKLRSKLVIAVMSDFQSEHLGSYEEQALKRIVAAKPDIIILPGDYIQQLPPQRWTEMRGFHDLMKRLNFTAPNGCYAVRGNVEDDSWPTIFEGLPGFHTFTRTATVTARDDVQIEGLSFADSFNDHLKIPANANQYLVIFGHGPDFSLGDVHGDLLIAGHTHGGQVQLPFFGPPITLSKVPRAWAAGGTFTVRDGTTLMLTRGVGMERFFAPRLRFLCRPEIVIIDIAPAG
jgi:uncharacterized protein